VVEKTKTALSAAATFLVGSKAIFDENYFAKQTTATLIITMDGERAKIKSNLLQNLEKDGDKYSFSEMVSEIQKYHQAGTLVNAVVTLQTNAAKTTSTETSALDAVQKEIAKKND